LWGGLASRGGLITDNPPAARYPQQQRDFPIARGRLRSNTKEKYKNATSG
jgi:hypothetical protein